MNDFVNKDIAIILKRLGFDAFVFGRYLKDEFEYDCGNWNGYDNENIVSAPLYSQVFKWFREKYNYDIEIGVSFGSVNYNTKVVDRKNYKFPYYPGSYVTYRECEVACLKQLIEILENENNIKLG